MNIQKPNPLLRLHALGQRVWLDNLSRTLLREGFLQKLVNEDRIAGVTSNPTIFYKAFSESPYYRDELKRLKSNTALSAEQRYEVLAIADIQEACDLLLPLHRSTLGNDGYVSLEVSPALAHDAAATVEAGLRLKAAAARNNLMIKVPATAAGLLAIESLVAQGCSVNVTLMFSLRHVRDVHAAYLRGMEKLAGNGGDLGKVRSVASVFLSRVDTLIDKQLETIGGNALALRGKSAVATARIAYAEDCLRRTQPAHTALAARGMHAQQLLWASTGTKNPAYSDVLYVESLIGPGTVNTVPDATLAAFRDHGCAEETLTQDVDAARAQLSSIRNLGIDLDEAGEQLQREGLKLFEDSFHQLLALTAN